ncbi:NAD(P)-binding domain-containing protein [Niabella ginsengisoli]|uniref:NAD(P)-binding domain-containing protein n=1 Tax=Niabella ginsengisoli TaxID=522298 RepID=A0ABS9SFR9_9BACT|nr:NAD(P)-binding domain-containing protein [Niabella ginsengisoli]MCH5597156.1 NAD(P)-binding domain-containing protein [Niabella ginsengisoli]
MNIVIIGSGNVAAVLGRKFVAAGHDIFQILSRNASAASELAYEWNTESANYNSLINKDADIYIVAVADDAIENVVNDIKLPGKIVAHTAAPLKWKY